MKSDQLKWKTEQERKAKEETEKIIEYIKQQDEKQQKIRDDLKRKRDVQGNQQQIMCDYLDGIEVSVTFVVVAAHIA